MESPLIHFAQPDWSSGFWGGLEYHTLIRFFKGTIVKYKFILFLPGYLKAQVLLGFRFKLQVGLLEFIAIGFRF